MLPIEGVLIGRPRLILYAAAALSLVAGLTHLWVMPEHLQEWWGYGTFFLVSGVAQVLYVPLLLRWPDRTILILGVGGNLAIVLLYLLTRTVGVPLFGPHTGEVEGLGFTDLCATTSELGIVVALGTVLLRNLSSERRRLVLLVVAVTLVSVGHVVHLLLR
jgi:hypothetical protein